MQQESRGQLDQVGKGLEGGKNIEMVRRFSEELQRGVYRRIQTLEDSEKGINQRSN